jgi:lysophospholipase L1-like esterase
MQARASTSAGGARTGRRHLSRNSPRRAAPTDVVLFVLGGNDSAGTAMARSALAGDIGRLLQQIRSGGSPHIIWIGPAHSTEEGVQRRHQGTADVQRAILPALGVEWHDGVPMTDDPATGRWRPLPAHRSSASRPHRSRLFTNETTCAGRRRRASPLLRASPAWVYWR